MLTYLENIIISIRRSQFDFSDTYSRGRDPFLGEMLFLAQVQLFCYVSIVYILCFIFLSFLELNLNNQSYLFK